MSQSFPFPRRGPVRLTFGIGLLILTVFGLVPAVAVLAVSFTDLRGLPYLPVHWVGIENYVSFFSPAKWSDSLNALRNTLIFAVVSTVIQIVLALAVAILLNRPLRGRNFYRAVVFMPTVLGVTVTGLVWSLMFNVTGGPAASILSLFGQQSAFFGDPKIALALVIVVQIWMVVGISVIIFLSGLQAIPEDLYEAGSIDGASGWQRFRFITIPMLAPSITANVLLGIVNALQSYQLTYVLTGPNNKSTQVLSLLVYVQGFGGASGTTLSQSQGYAAAISMVQFAIVGIVSLLALWYLRKREAKL
ncbi:carbohydrate ABC transporter permease [Microbacterium dextranolyticum]|uniref:Sugar ABC transporter permease n=1 Tax=Microbacterium dextranolyticum TaxID=36806 RepID=A0A9W6HKG1_9MICO|nr:sugar ABC transporter permease [Microbacterium dextranolyticum]MBM7461914.1 raffinose/stachyose/melibiose transport system permease protein [Microbacterium dextranolyticum]GLJ94153.1 sugar ABC transporter permease [Microbacterium dextranolyticum]